MRIYVDDIYMVAEEYGLDGAMLLNDILESWGYFASKHLGRCGIDEAMRFSAFALKERLATRERLGECAPYNHGGDDESRSR